MMMTANADHGSINFEFDKNLVANISDQIKKLQFLLHYRAKQRAINVSSFVICI
jgi:hypothetical protein